MKNVSSRIFFTLLFLLLLLVAHRFISNTISGYLDRTNSQVSTVESIDDSNCEDDVSLCVTVETTDGHQLLLSKQHLDSTALTEGNRILISEGENGEYLFTGYYRAGVILPAFIIFSLIVIGVTKLAGVRALLSLIVSLFFISALLLPAVVSGHNLILVLGLGGFLLLGVLIFISHGFNSITLTALAGSGVALGVSVIFAFIFSKMLNITGVGDEYSAMLALGSDISINIRDLLIGSFILGGIAVLDDASVSQATVVSELKNSSLSPLKVYNSAMNVGISHISSLINTLFLAYVASALPLVVMIYLNSTDIFTLLNSDLLAEEIVRILTGSIALILSIPITTFLAVTFISDGKSSSTPHHH